MDKAFAVASVKDLSLYSRKALKNTAWQSPPIIPTSGPGWRQEDPWNSLNRLSPNQCHRFGERLCLET